MTALIIHESFVKQRQQTLPRCDLFNVTISFLFLFLVLTSSSIIFRKHTIWFLGDAKTCSLALPACRIKIKTCTSFYKSFPHSTLPVAFGSLFYCWMTTVFLPHDSDATCARGRQRRQTTDSDQSAPSAGLVYLLVRVDEEENLKENQRVWAAVSNVTVVFERKQKTWIWIWSCGSIGS